MINPPTYRSSDGNYNSNRIVLEEVRKSLARINSPGYVPSPEVKARMDAIDDATQLLIDDNEKCTRITAEDLSLRVG